MSWHQQTDQIKHHGSLYLSSSTYRCESWTIWQSLLGLAALWRNVALVTDSTKETILVARPSASRTFMPNVSECSVFASPLVAHAPPSRNHVPHHPFLLTLLPFDIVKVSHFPFHNAVLLPDFSSFSCFTIYQHFPPFWFTLFFENFFNIWVRKAGFSSLLTMKWSAIHICMLLQERLMLSWFLLSSVNWCLP